MYCSSCGIEIPEGVQFCSGCGKPTSPTPESPGVVDVTDILEARRPRNK
jgi:hypothetical protein